MKNLTYRELAQAIADMPEARKDDNVSVYLDSEFYPVAAVEKADGEQDVLDAGHYVLPVEADCDDCAVLQSGDVSPCARCVNKSEFKPFK